MNIDYFSLLGRGKINEDIIQTVQDRLLLKYDESFETIKIGKRYGTYNNDTASVICHPSKNNKILFTATLNIDRVTFDDDYLIRIICSELEQIIKKEYQKQEIESLVKVNIFGVKKPTKKINLKTFQEKEGKAKVLVNIYLKGANHKKDSKEVMKEIKNTVTLPLKGNILELSNENFDKLKSIIGEIPGDNSFTVPQERIIKKYRVEEV